MKILTIANQKGGVGKTTTTVSLAGLLCQQCQRVLVIDLDPHGSLTNYFGLKDQIKLQGSYGLLTQERFDTELVSQYIISSHFANLDVIPANLLLATIEKSGIRHKMGLVIRKALKHVEHLYDFVLLDCPPIMGVLMVNALAASELVVIPTQTEHLALKGLESMVSTIKMVSRSQKRMLDYLVVPTMYDQRTLACQKALAQMAHHYSPYVWSDTIPLDTRFRDASVAQCSISYYAPTARGTTAYRTLLKHILNLLLNKQIEQHTAQSL